MFGSNTEIADVNFEWPKLAELESLRRNAFLKVITMYKTEEHILVGVKC